MIVGDFNCTRGSASVHAAFPGFDEAWSVAGQGWGASWPRETPILHIDLALVSGRMRVERCELHDPGIGHHRLNALSCSRRAR
jgi:endonuclease/exonuclease/phosphatase family metal-dependent hydrolase